MAATPPIPRDEDLYDEAGYSACIPASPMQSPPERRPTGGAISTSMDAAKAGGRTMLMLAFYLAAYPQAERTRSPPDAPATAAEHYIRWGRARGYRPNAATPPPADPACRRHISRTYGPICRTQPT